MSKSEPDINTNADNGAVNESFENGNEDKRKRRRRRRQELQENMENAENADNEENETKQPETQPRRERRRRRKEENNDQVASPVTNNRSIPLGITAHLEDLQDDIEERAGDEEISAANNLTMSKSHRQAPTTQMTGDSVYVEGPRRFREENHDKFIRNRQKEAELQQKTMEKLNLGEYGSDNELLINSMNIQTRFRVCATFLHGLFAGLLVMHSVFLFVPVVGQSNWVEFITNYTTILRPFSIFCYLSFIIISVSLWDRLNVGESERGTCDLAQSGLLLSLILMFIAFVINNTLYLYNSKFANYYLNSSSSVYTTELTSNFDIWRILYTVNCCLVTISWFIVSMVPSYDALVNLMLSSLQSNYYNNHNHGNLVNGYTSHK